MNISQSALSVQIQALEDQLGQKLFERRGKQLILTEAGHIALDHADVIFAAGEELWGTLHSRRPSAREVLRVGALSTLSRNFQIGFLKPLLSRQDVRIVLHSGSLDQLLQALEAHRIDALLTNMVPPRDAATPWVAHLIDEEPVSLVARSDHLVARRDLDWVLKNEPLILPSADSGIRLGFDALADRLDIRPRIAAEGDDMAMLRLLTREGVGVAVVPPIVVQDELSSGLLSELAQLPGLTESFFALTLSRRFPNPLLRELIETG